MKYIILLFLLALTTGCATNNSNAFYWGGYSNTLYKYKSTPNDETLAKHVKQLEKIIEYSKEKNKEVPPGVHAELGYRYAQMNKVAEAQTQYDAEMALYPESAVFVSKLKKQLAEK